MTKRPARRKQPARRAAKKTTAGKRTTGKKSEDRKSGKKPIPWLATYPDDITWDATLKGQPVYSLLDKAVARYPEKVCTDFLGRETTYGEIGALVEHAASGLRQRGVGRGARIGLLLPNTPTYLIFYYAILKTGACVVNFNPLYTVEELDFQIRDSGTTMMVTLDLKLLFTKVEALVERGVLEHSIVCSFAALLPPVKRILFNLFKSGNIANLTRSPIAPAIIPEQEIFDNDGIAQNASVQPEKDLAVLQYTGGTTGTPKGAMLTHANLTINVEQVQRWATNIHQGEERIMGILPFFHVFAMTTVLNLGIAMGARLILMPKFELKDALKLISRTKATVLPGVPTMYNAMMNHPGLDKLDLSSLKFCISGGAALPIEVKHGFEALTNCVLVEGYGLSETSPVATANPVDGPIREGSIGLPLPGTILSIRAIDDPEKEMPLGEKGEICITGPQVMSGYWEKPDETRDAFTGEFFRTGDAGYMDEEGFTYIVDRLKDMIICSGFNVYPRRIEEAIYEFPAVEEVTVIGIPDDYRGEAPKAFIKLRKGHIAQADEILEFLKPKISKIEMPGEIEFRDSLPKTMIGKLSKKELRSNNSGLKT